MINFISEKYPQGATLEQVRLFLRDRSGADIETVKKESSTVYKVYSSAATYLKPAEASKPSLEGKETAGVKKNMEATEEFPQGVLAVVKTHDHQTINIRDQEIYDEIFNTIGKAFQKTKKEENKPQGS